MIQQVSSATPLKEVDWYGRGDGLADIRIRKHISTVKHEATETEAAWTEYTAEEAYTVRSLTEQEAVEQADEIWNDVEQASRPAEARLSDVEKSSLDNTEAIADLYVMLTGGAA